jgi:inosine/xanthosine triphosphate pyrophosphatase family protein
MKKTIYFITGNQNKLKEFTQIIGEISSYDFQTKSIDLPEYQVIMLKYFLNYISIIFLFSRVNQKI